MMDRAWQCCFFPKIILAILVYSCVRLRISNRDGFSWLFPLAYQSSGLETSSPRKKVPLLTRIKGRQLIIKDFYSLPGSSCWTRESPHISSGHNWCRCDRSPGLQGWRAAKSVCRTKGKREYHGRRPGKIYWRTGGSLQGPGRGRAIHWWIT